jgi:hypothetical protein
MTFSNAEKAACARREVGYRKHVYAGLVRKGFKTEQEARREIAIMEEIANDYSRAESADLFTLSGE